MFFETIDFLCMLTGSIVPMVSFVAGPFFGKFVNMLITSYKRKQCNSEQKN